MAKIERISGYNIINLTASVGRNSVNMRDDVMVAQALMKHAPEERGVFGKVKLPEPTGIMTAQWVGIIEDYQRYLKRVKRENISVDGKIDRAVGERAFGKKGAWTILCLNSELLEIKLLKGGAGNELQDLFRRFPQLEKVLEMPVGSLELTLEGGNGVGSLGLGLE